MRIAESHRRKFFGFTLTELLIAMAILSALVLLLASLMGGISRAWVTGEQQVETFQDGRAIIEIMSRELSQALISPKLQFVQNPLLPSGANQRANSSCVFWQAGLFSTNAGNLCEVGYFLSEDAQHNFQLKRFFVPPTDATNYQIFATAPSDTSAPWVTSFIGTSALNTVVSDGVVAFWVRCFDLNGDPIPWLSNTTTTNGDTTAIPLQFNSASHFQPAIRGQPASFRYTRPSSTASAHQLPSSIEITIVTIDSKTMERSRAAIPAMPSSVPSGFPDVSPVGYGPEDIPNAVTWFNQQLIANKIKTSRTFSTTVVLKNLVP
jgi:prepilin-type N-terminal cleavage/methylation domain-containing protein